MIYCKTINVVFLLFLQITKDVSFVIPFSVFCYYLDKFLDKLWSSVLKYQESIPCYSVDNNWMFVVPYFLEWGRLFLLPNGKKKISTWTTEVKKLNFPITNDYFEDTVTNFDRHVLKGIFSMVQTLYTEQNPQGVHSVVKKTGGGWLDSLGSGILVGKRYFQKY